MVPLRLFGQIGIKASLSGLKEGLSSGGGKAEKDHEKRN
jgi:hypothetical protein